MELTLAESFRRGASVAKANPLIPVANATKPAYKKGNLEIPAMAKIAQTARALYMALDGKISIIETTEIIGDDVIDVVAGHLNSNPQASFRITQDHDIGPFVSKMMILDTGIRNASHDFDIVENLLVQWIGRVCPEEEEKVERALKRLIKTRAQELKPHDTAEQETDNVVAFKR